VKLSRTNFGFLAFRSLTSAGFAVGSLVAFGTTSAGVLRAALVAADGVELVTDLTAALSEAVLATGSTATWAAGLAGTVASLPVASLPVALTALLVTALTALGEDKGAEDAPAVLLMLG
jgi:hypothetical protein